MPIKTKIGDSFASDFNDGDLSVWGLLWSQLVWIYIFRITVNAVSGSSNQPSTVNGS